jgi:hypothetical protein
VCGLFGLGYGVEKFVDSFLARHEKWLAHPSPQPLSVLRRALPVPDEIAEYTPTRTGARLALRRLLKASSTGQAILVTPANVSCVIQHHEVAKLVVGVNVGGLVALNLVIELLRLAIGSAVTTVALGQLTSGMAALEDLLPSLRSDRISGLPPHDRLAYVSQELLLWLQSERTSARGGGGSSNWAQRFLTECNLGFSKRFARANEPLLLELEANHPRFAAWRAARRTGRRVQVVLRQTHRRILRGGWTIATPRA